jgi:ribosomal protein S18 acetylase RimI-like enzyme
MREADMRYILLRPSNPSPSPDDKSGPATPISGFIAFMLTLEEEQPVIYIYEIHTVPAARGIGLGKHMMSLIETIGRNAGMWKSMLTVFTRNTHAEELYRRLGYVVDEIGPQVRKLRGGKIKRPEYFIMSKELQEGL